MNVSPYSATRELWVMDVVILNHGRVKRTTPKLPLSSPYFHATSPGGLLRPDRFDVNQLLYTVSLQQHNVRTHDTPAVTLTTRLPRSFVLA
ncbi:hypothetical protein TNCV_222741 [Trichonephila clavipes]|nr:hypothetical protein TNCV_222741 [Trichonephila clavipes]